MTTVPSSPSNKIKYINNKELLGEIHRSKKTFCYYVEPQYADHDTIVRSISEITPELIQAVREKKAKPRGKPAIAIDTILPESIVVRVMTYEHIPLDPDRVRKSRVTDQSYARTTFPPFKHYILLDTGPKEVLRSHWKDGFDNGSFDPDSGRINDRLARMFMMLVERYSRRGNWRGYTYVDEMRSQALVQLSQIGLQFDESKSDNPFAFYTTAIRNCLGGDTLVLTKEFGSVPIEEISEKDVTLLDGNGDWVKCHIFDHGVQETQLTYFQGQGGKKIEIWSTLNHGWISENTRVETKDFNRHNTKINDLRPSKVVKNEESYQKGLTHGVIYGDGSANKNCKDFYYIRICSNISDFMPIFEKYPVFYAPSYNGDPTFSISQAWANLKKFPENPGEDTDYLLGFLRGWFAADGCVSKVPTPTLCGDEAEYNWLKTWGPIVGWHINNFTTLAKVTNFGERKKQSLNIHLKKASMHSEDFILSKHRERWETRKETEKQWFVYGSRQGNIENKYQRVYCPVVETTQSFALSSGIHSSNCFTRVLNLEKKSQNIRDDLLIIAGAQPSYTRQIDNELDHRFADYAAQAAAQAAAKEAKKPE